jgi:hypothetical protein
MYHYIYKYTLQLWWCRRLSVNLLLYLLYAIITGGCRPGASGVVTSIARCCRRLMSPLYEPCAHKILSLCTSPCCPQCCKSHSVMVAYGWIHALLTTPSRATIFENSYRRNAHFSFVNISYSTWSKIKIRSECEFYCHKRRFEKLGSSTLCHINIKTRYCKSNHLKSSVYAICLYLFFYQPKSVTVK